MSVITCRTHVEELDFNPYQSVDPLEPKDATPTNIRPFYPSDSLHHNIP